MTQLKEQIEALRGAHPELVDILTELAGQVETLETKVENLEAGILEDDEEDEEEGAAGGEGTEGATAEGAAGATGGKRAGRRRRRRQQTQS